MCFKRLCFVIWICSLICSNISRGEWVCLCDLDNMRFGLFQHLYSLHSHSKLFPTPKKGFPFGGITSFGAMASHIPDGGSCLVVFGPHVGVDSTGKVGTVERRGRENGGAASGYVSQVHTGAATKYGPPEIPDDAQQNFVGTALLPYAAHLEKAEDKMAELPYALYDAQKKLMDTIVKAGCGSVAGEGKVTVLGGIQVNTPSGKSDYFLPLSFEVYDNKGTMIEDLGEAIEAGKKPTFA